MRFGGRVILLDSSPQIDSLTRLRDGIKNKLGNQAECTEVTIDKSLKVRRGALSNRNVLTRDERIAKLLETDRWQEGDPILGMPKVRVQKISLKKKKKTKKEEEETPAKKKK
jgi:small basic protein (TIGR04137 family)